jgi:hypothetical protein
MIMQHLVNALLLVSLAVQPQETVPTEAGQQIFPAALPASNSANGEQGSAALLVEPAAIVIPKDTPIHLMTLTEVTTKTDDIGHRYKLRVDKDVQIDGATIIPVGTLAWGEVTSSESSGNLGKGGSLTARLLYVELNGQHIPISGDTSSKSRTATAETVVSVLSIGLLGLFAKGNNAKIKAGEKTTAFVSEDTILRTLTE